MKYTCFFIYGMVWSFLTGLVLGAPIEILKRELLKPSQDSFYDAPRNLTEYKHGDVIRHRVINGVGFVKIELDLKEIHQFLVCSKDALDKPNAIVTTLLVPYNADPRKLLSYHIAQDTSDYDCAISYAIQTNSTIDTWATPQVEEILFENALYNGSYVVLPDHEGPKAEFAVGKQAGHAALDSVLAVLNSDLTDLDKDTKVAMWGYSGGSLPGVWASHLAPSYAPSINLVGVAIGGILIDVYHILNANMGTPFAGLIIAGLSGLASQYPEVKNLLNENLISEEKAKEFWEINKKCLAPYIFTYPYATLGDFAKDNGSAVFSPEAQPYAMEQSVLTYNATPETPMFLYNSKGDEIIPANDTDKLYKRLCDRHVNVEYHQDNFGEHITQYLLGAGSALRWVEDRLNGAPPAKGCHKYEVLSNILTDKGFEGFLDIMGSAFSTIFRSNIGPKSSKLAKRDFLTNLELTREPSPREIESAVQKLLKKYLK